jgi:tetratricopeptide (TPR) repeat protein
MAICHLKSGKPGEALTCCDEVQCRDWSLGTPEAHLGPHGLPAFKCGSLFDVPQALQHGLDHVKALYRRGLALEELHRLQEALQSAQLVLKLDPGNKVGRWRGMPGSLSLSFVADSDVDC